MDLQGNTDASPMILPLQKKGTHKHCKITKSDEYISIRTAGDLKNIEFT